MAAVGTPLQKEAGVEDSIDLMMEDMLRAGKNYNHVDPASQTSAVHREIGLEFLEFMAATLRTNTIHRQARHHQRKFRRESSSSTKPSVLSSRGASSALRVALKWSSILLKPQRASCWLWRFL